MSDPANDEVQRYEAPPPGALGPWVKAVAMGSALALTAWKAPGCLDDRARDDAESCRKAKVEASESVGDACAPSATGVVALAFPWSRTQAQRRRRNLAAAAAEADLDWASVQHPSRAALAASADRAIAGMRAGASDRGDSAKELETLEGEWTGRLFHFGALDAVAARDPATGPLVLRARLARGDLDGARIAARVASEDPAYGHDDALRRGALLALLGERGPAVEALIASNLGWNGKSRDARAALLLLGATAEEAGFAPASGLADHELVRFLFADPAWGRGRRSDLASAALRSGLLASAERYRLLAEVAAPATSDATGVALALASVSRAENGLASPSAWTLALEEELGAELWRSSGFPVPAPELFRAASARLLDLAASLATKAPDARALEALALDPVAVSSGAFRKAAWVLRLEGASHALAVMDRRGAIEDAQAASALAPPGRAWFSVAVLVRAGAFDAALALAEPALASGAGLQASDVAWLRIARARVRVRKGDMEAAAADLDAASADDSPLRDEARILRLVLARRAGKDAASSPPLTTTSGWAKIVGMPPEERRAARMKRPAEPLRTTFVDVALVALAASPGDDVEAWLDRAAPPPGHDLRAYLRSRAELAGWLGDDAVAEELAKRASVLDALVVDGRTAILARLAGL